MLIDALGLLRADGAPSDPRVIATEHGHTSVVRHGATGRAVIPIHKTGKNGLPIVVMADADTGSVGTGTSSVVVTIQASDAEAFNDGIELVATFPAQTMADQTEVLMVRRVHTQKRYLRSVITVTLTGNTTFSRDYLIFVGHALMNI